MKTIQEIYEQDSIRLIEDEILLSVNTSKWDDYYEVEFIKRLLEMRK